MSRAAFVVNPTKVTDLAGLRRRVETFLSKADWDEPLWLETTVEDPGVGMCKQAVDEGCAVVFVCGGDGTVMAAATALAGTDVPMAIVPLGTGNLLGLFQLGSLPHAADEIPSGPVTMMCGHGERAMTAASLLTARGRTDVSVLAGGPDDWATATGRAFA